LALAAAGELLSEALVLAPESEVRVVQGAWSSQLWVTGALNHRGRGHRDRSHAAASQASTVVEHDDALCHRGRLRRL
jgi:hypothetical protein